jgi:choline-phosphate cytidylyltransferase
MQAKNLFENVYLIVGACNDELASSLKGKTVLNEKERYESLKHSRYVDEIITDAPLIITEDFLNKHKIDFVAQDPVIKIYFNENFYERVFNFKEPYPADGYSDVYKFVKERGMFLPTSRTESISTTDIISRILKEYDAFTERNLRKSCNPKDLDIKHHVKVKKSFIYRFESIIFF